MILLALYVDDMLLASKNTYELNALKAKLHEAFDTKDLHEAFEATKQWILDESYIAR